jgi:hypothetical protein
MRHRHGAEMAREFARLAGSRREDVIARAACDLQDQRTSEDRHERADR